VTGVQTCALPISKEELPIWTMLLNKVYEETFKTKEK